MSQIFHPSTNPISKVSIFGAVFFLGALVTLVFFIYRSPYVTKVGEVVEQPVPFYHEHHVSGLGIDCRYCHTSVESSSYAGIPPTHTCMSCHSMVWTEADVLEPVRQSYATGQPLQWNKVHDLADFVYFNHSIHVKNGVGCSSCHGNVAQMPQVWKAEPMTMGWCLECHRDPTPYLRPQEEIYNMAWEPPADQLVLGEQLIKAYHIDADDNRLMNCNICHR